MFITFEGGEGSGKSTQSRLLKDYLEKNNKQVVLTREPGGSAGAEEIRNLIVSGNTDKWSTNTELLLIYAARSDHWEKIIKPSLDSGKIVLCDRFSDSTLAYQGYGKEYDFDFLETLYKKIIGTKQPDITFIFDFDVSIGLNRASKRMQRLTSAENRFENMDISFHEKVREGFLKIAQQNQQRCRVIDASLSMQVIHSKIVEYIKSFL